jgi:hypothetical protein
MKKRGEICLFRSAVKCHHLRTILILHPLYFAPVRTFCRPCQASLPPLSSSFYRPCQALFTSVKFICRPCQPPCAAPVSPLCPRPCQPPKKNADPVITLGPPLSVPLCRPCQPPCAATVSPLVPPLSPPECCSCQLRCAAPFGP